MTFEFRSFTGVRDPNESAVEPQVLCDVKAEEKGKLDPNAE